MYLTPRLDHASELLSTVITITSFSASCYTEYEKYYKKNLCNQSSHNRKLERFLLQTYREAITECYHELTSCAVSKDKWDTK